MAATSSFTGPADPELWELTRVAVYAAQEAVDAHLTSKGYRPRVEVPSVREFDSGWPDIRSTRLLPPDDAPTDFSALFGTQRDQLKPIAFSDVPELAALIDYVRGRDDIYSRLTMASAGSQDMELRMFEHEVADLPLSLLDRARATGASSDEELLALYLERERAWLLNPLPVEYVIPFALTAFDLDRTLVIDETTRIEPLDERTQAARAPSVYYSQGSVPDAVVGAATHALVLSGHQMPNPGPMPRVFGGVVEQPPLDDADLVCEALRILSHVTVGYAQILSRPLGWADRWTHDLPTFIPVKTLRRYPDQFDDYGWLRPPNPIPADTLAQLPTLVASLRVAPPRIRLASRRLSTATLRADEDDRTVDACIGLEALLGEGRDELSHRMALRAATALATAEDPANPQVIYDLVKKVYAHRSAVVHGTEGGKSRRIPFAGATRTADSIAVFLLRELLVDVLTRSGGWTPQSLDADLLNSLGPAAQERDTDT